VSTREAIAVSPGDLSARTRAEARLVVGVARLLALVPPRHLRTLLSTVRRGARPASYAEAAAARDSAVAVSVICAGDGCLPRSIASALLCRVHGTWPTWRVGARTAPFVAHAWVEAEGRPVREELAVEAFAPLVTIPPCRERA
jgi:hypothetical protein